jgi:hypothetical protein
MYQLTVVNFIQTDNTLTWQEVIKFIRVLKRIYA